VSSGGQNGLRNAGLIVTLILHGAIIAVLVAGEQIFGLGGGKDAEARFENSETIEASLAFKAVDPKDRQPQKQKKKKYRPDDRAPVIKDETAPPRPDEKPPDHKVKVNKDEIDIESTLKKNKLQDESLSSTGAEEVPKEGATDGSEWGTEKDAKGHPYAGELKGRIYGAWQLPSLEQGTGEAVGCVKLDREGKIVDRHVKTKSGNANLDRSVELALKQAPDMEDPVPDDLIDLMTAKGICFRFTP
jgi:hypothetical protein